MTIEISKFRHDENFRPVGEPIRKTVSGRTTAELKSAWYREMNENDLSIFLPCYISDIDFDESNETEGTK